MNTTRIKANNAPRPLPRAGWRWLTGTEPEHGAQPIRGRIAAPPARSAAPRVSCA